MADFSTTVWGENDGDLPVDPPVNTPQPPGLGTKGIVSLVVLGFILLLALKENR